MLDAYRNSVMRFRCTSEQLIFLILSSLFSFTQIPYRPLSLQPWLKQFTCK